MNAPKRVVGTTRLPDPLPDGSHVMKRDCGCYLILEPGDVVSEFVCDHGYFSATPRTPPPPDGIIALG